MRFLYFLVLSALSLIHFNAHAEDAPLVVASIKPLHSLVASIMEGSGESPRLIVDGSQSPHGFQLKPSHRQALADADVVFYIDDGFETFLPAALATTKPGAIHLALLQAMPLDRLTERFADADHPHSDLAPTNYHLWLSAANASAMAQKIAEVLSEKFPANKDVYLKNAHELRVALQRKDAEISHLLAPVMGKPFLLFHDGYYYFEQRYGLTAAGVITQDPNQPISGVKMLQLRQQIKAQNIACVFREPQFSSKLVDQIVDGTKARVGLIDPEGASITPGPELYVTLLDRLAESYLRCLSDPETETPPTQQ